MPVIEQTNSKLGQELSAARAQSDRLFAILKPESLFERPIAQRHRVIFYVGHLDGFDSIQIVREGLGIKSSEPELDNLFQAGIDPDSSNLPIDRPSDWPSLERVKRYVRDCRTRVDEFLDRAPEDVALMALEHRLMHLETLAYMFHNFDYGLKYVDEEREETVARNGKQEWREIPAGEAVLGKRKGDSFGWDNEFDELRTHVPSFCIQRYDVTNGDYLKFVAQGASIPNFWVERDGEFFLRGMMREYPLPLDWPAYVTQQEAQAYAKWQGKELPAEAQFHRAAYATPDGKTREHPWGSASPTTNYGNFDFKRWDPESAYAHPEGDSAFGVSQLVGNGWEWTSTPFRPFPDFEPRASYPGYSANFFDNEHYVIKGGSSQTASRLLRRSFRNWFRRDYPYMYATFRCVEN